MKKNIDLQPTLEGSRVTVRPIAMFDWDAMFAAAADPKIWELHPDSNRYTEQVFRPFFDGAVDSGSAFTIIDRQNGNVMGSSRYHGHDPVIREIEIGWTFLTRDYWGGSFNSEIKRLMVDHAFSFVDTVVFWVDESNLRSRRAMEKVGGVLRDGIQVRDGAGDRPYVIYEIRKDVRQTS
jgi:RimJ/RimL family protein N-acetyltransferase